MVCSVSSPSILFEKGNDYKIKVEYQLCSSEVQFQGGDAVWTRTAASRCP